VTAPHGDALTLTVFAATLLATFAAAWLGRRHAGGGHDGLADEKLNRWLIGLSAGAAANSGFIVTGAVGLGYTGGVRWLLLPLGWLIGDILFWRVFPSRVNAFGKRSRATTLSELLTLDVPGRTGTILSLLAAALVTICLAGYIAAQWLAGQKFLAGAFGVPDIAALGLFALMIVSYTAIGGFRGSVYVDSLQAVVRVIGTALALGAVWFVARSDAGNGPRLAAAGPHFLDLLGDGGAATAAGTLLGFAAAALGFGLGQPQIISRYLAGASPRETQAAWWIYMGFVQFTWISMTLFGVMLRGVMPALADPEAGLSVFFETKMPPVLTGIIIADVFATIAATSNALLVAIGQSVAHDVAPRLLRRGATLPLGPVCAVIGAATMGLSLATDSSVMSLALGSVSLIGAGLAPAVMARVLGWRFTGVSLIAAVVTGVVVALAWRLAGLAGTINEAAPGIAAGMLANALVARLTPRAVV
jgi:SSS family solute:Na+ symporter/sodium/proline symporter